MKTPKEKSDAASSSEIERLIAHLEMRKHPEGGHFSVYFEDTGKIYDSNLTEDKNVARPFSNGIFFLIPGGIKTTLHRLPMNEIWHFCLGSPLKIFQILPSGKLQTVVLGNDIFNGEKLLYVIEKGSWFGSYSLGDYSLVTCTTSPGFRMEDLEIVSSSELMKRYPNAKSSLAAFH